jgi:hypothetical protein
MIRSDKTCSLALIVLAVLFAAAGTLAAQDTSPSAAPKQTASPAAKKKTSPPKAPAPVALELEPKAVEILNATSNKLASAHTLTFTAVEAFESTWSKNSSSLKWPGLGFCTRLSGASELTIQS